jgi:hypothetical protein
MMSSFRENSEQEEEVKHLKLFRTSRQSQDWEGAWLVGQFLIRVYKIKWRHDTHTGNQSNFRQF